MYPSSSNSVISTRRTGTPVAWITLTADRATTYKRNLRARALHLQLYLEV